MSILIFHFTILFKSDTFETKSGIRGLSKSFSEIPNEPEYLNSQYSHIDMCSFHLAKNNASSGNRLEKNDDPMMITDELFMK